MGGKELDLHGLYTRVTTLGGFAKVSGSFNLYFPLAGLFQKVSFDPGVGARGRGGWPAGAKGVLFAPSRWHGGGRRRGCFWPGGSRARGGRGARAGGRPGAGSRPARCPAGPAGSERRGGECGRAGRPPEPRARARPPARSLARESALPPLPL